MLRIERQNQTAILTLDRPEAKNAFAQAMLPPLEEALLSIKTDPSCRAVLITGAGDAFSAGADLKERRSMSAADVTRFLTRIGQLFTLLEELGQPTIACINGYAFGGGLELALCCDFRLLADTATVGLTETRLGIIPGAGGTQRLPRLVGVARAKELIFSGRKIDAAEALRIGLADGVYPADSLIANGLAMAESFSHSAPIAVAQAKFAIRHGMDASLGTGLMIEQKAYQITLPTRDRQEALRAFAEKRAPRFTGE